MPEDEGIVFICGMMSSSMEQFYHHVIQGANLEVVWCQDRDIYSPKEAWMTVKMVSCYSVHGACKSIDNKNKQSRSAETEERDQ